jgi:hypothetical protein
MRNTCEFLVGKYQRKITLSKELGVDGKIVLERSLGKFSEKLWTGFIWLRLQKSGRLLGTQ